MRRKLKNIRVRDGQFHYRFLYQGREYTGPTGLAAVGANQTSAAKFAAQKIAEIRGERHRRDTPFDVAAGRFVAFCELSEYREHRSTARRIKGSFTTLVEFFKSTPVRTIAENPGLIDDYKAFRLTEHQVQDVTLRHDLHALSLFFGRYAIKRGLADRNPLSRLARQQGRGVTIPGDTDAVRVHPLSADEESLYFERAYAITDKRGMRNLYDLAKIMIAQGARPDEILSSPKSAFDAERGELQILKGKSKSARRTLYLTDESVAILKARMSTPGPWLFPGDRNSSKHVVRLNAAHDDACAPEPTKDDPNPQVLTFVLYDLRHTFGTRMALETDPFTLAAIMGHANLRTIQRYVHPSDEAKRTAMERYQAARNRAKLKVVGK